MQTNKYNLFFSTNYKYFKLSNTNILFENGTYTSHNKNSYIRENFINPNVNS